MLSVIREHADSWLIKAILWLIILAFVGTIFYSWGMGGASSSGGGVIATVHGEKIFQGEYERTFNNLVDFYRQQFKNQFSDEMIKKLDLKTQALEALVQKKLLLQEAEKQNLRISDAELISHIHELPVFQSEKKFSEKSYRNYLQFQRVTPGEFEDNQRENLILNKLEKLFGSSAKVSQNEIMETFIQEEEKSKLDYVRFNSDHFQVDKTFTDQELDVFFQANKKQFEIPSQIKVEYLKIEPKTYLAEIEPRDEDIEDYYQTKIANFRVKKMYRASHILAHIKSSDIEGDATPEEKQKQAEDKAKARITELLGKVKAGADFGEIAKKHSDDPGSGSQGGSLGDFPKGTMVSTFESALDKLEVGGISEPVLTPFGYHIIKLESRTEERFKLLEEVREEVIQSLKEIKARQKVRRMAKHIYQEAEKNGDLKSAAGNNQVQTTISDFFSRENHNLPEIGAHPQFYNTAFSLRENKVSQPIHTQEASFILKLVGNKEAHIPELKEVKKTVEQALIERVNEEQTSSKFKELKQKLAQEKDLEKIIKGLGLSVKHTPFFSMADSIPGIGDISEIKEKALAMKVGDTASAKVRNRFYLFKRVEKEDAGKPDKEQAQKILKQLKQEKSRQIFQEWVDNLKARADILIDKTLM
ncbi:MAG: SurA N-terminal domain-containing protein [Nitrospinae bacterium]|nr:SurA N-terminal domain-containing protein [Nitrospinota bacterium]MBL7018980.1 SurA N-terminal domain-containing protein [Nitrospinaceae bacterium]